MTIPQPTGSLHTWFPATLEQPDGSLIRRARVYVTPEGLFVYTLVPGDGVTPNYWWPINWAATSQPKRSTATDMNGYVITTDTGKVVVHTSGQGCGCSNPLKRWTPAFAGTTLSVWPSAGEGA
jgi:hypothetical protein